MKNTVKKNMEHSEMEWMFDEYDKSFACLYSKNPNVKFVVRRYLRDSESFEVILYHTPHHQHRVIDYFSSKEEAMSFVEDLIKDIKTMG